MRIAMESFSGAIVAAAMGLAAAGQAPPAVPASAADPFQPDYRQELNNQSQTTSEQTKATPDAAQPAATVSQSVEAEAALAMPTKAVKQLQSFTDADIKFSLRELMQILRDSRHEGWVLAAYPDPKTGHPLIGAGFTLDLPARDHPQPDQLNPHPFIEPSSAELWQAAGLDAQRLQTILTQFDDRMAAWTKKGFRRKIKTLTPQISDDDATQLLRVSAIEAVFNAKGYCRDFDRLSAPQQMALTQLVYQMGFNLQEFTQFLALINGYSGSTEAAAVSPAANNLASDAGYWKTVQQSLVQSQWARLYRVRAVAVIAMLDPEYGDAPRTAEQRVGAMLRPAVVHRRGARGGASRPAASRTAPRGERRWAGRASKRRQSKRGV